MGRAARDRNQQRWQATSCLERLVCGRTKRVLSRRQPGHALGIDANRRSPQPLPGRRNCQTCSIRRKSGNDLRHTLRIGRPAPLTSVARSSNALICFSLKSPAQPSPCHVRGAGTPATIKRACGRAEQSLRQGTRPGERTRRAVAASVRPPSLRPSKVRRVPQWAILRDCGPLCAPLHSLAYQIRESVRKAGFDGHPLHLPLQRGAAFRRRGPQTSEKMARPERLELPTYWFVASRSIQLSYGRAYSSVARRVSFVNLQAREAGVSESLSRRSATGTE